MSMPFIFHNYWFAMWFYYFLAVVAVVAVVVALKLGMSTKAPVDAGGDEAVKPASDERLPFRRKRYILTSAEYAFYKALREATGDRYLIAPQVHLEGLIEVDHIDPQWRTYMNKIDRKSVDFVLFDKQTVQALLSVELDDSSHRRPDRQARDSFVNRIFASAGLKLVRVPVQAAYPVGQLQKLLNQYLHDSPPVPDGAAGPRARSKAA
jgi:hypothetical protein